MVLIPAESTNSTFSLNSVHFINMRLKNIASKKKSTETKSLEFTVATVSFFNPLITEE